MTEAASEGALRSLRSRLSVLKHCDGDGEIFSAAASTEAARLIEAVREQSRNRMVDGWDGVALCTVGELYWKRYLMVGSGETRWDEAALVVLARPFRRNRRAVPEALWGPLERVDESVLALTLIERSASDLADAAELMLRRDPDALMALGTSLDLALAMVAPGDPGRAFLQSALAAVRLVQHDLGLDSRALDSAIELSTAASVRLPTGWHRQAEHLSRLCLLLWMRYRRDGKDADLALSVKAGRSAVAAAGESGEALPGCCNNLATALLAAYEKNGDGAVLEEAVQVARMAVMSDRCESPTALLHATTLAAVLSHHFLVTGDREVLREAEHVVVTTMGSVGPANRYLSVAKGRLAEVEHLLSDRDDVGAVRRTRAVRRRRWLWWRG